MCKYFGINFEFNQNLFFSKIENSIKSKNSSYVCVVDANVLTIAHNDEEYQNILNSSLVNTCDGSSIALLLNMIYDKDFKALNGPTIFKKLILENKRQVLLGGDEKITELVLRKLKQDKPNSEINIIPLPFQSVESFEYAQIAAEINSLEPDIIWVSLGAPKQERFMHNLLPHINQGVMFGIGAAFSFYVGQIKMPKVSIGGLNLLWLSRIITEPRKQLKRMYPYVKLMPKLYLQEKEKAKKS